MSEDEFTRLFKYMQTEFASIHAQLEQTAKKSDLDRLITTIDSFLKRLDNIEANDLARDRQFNRLLEWARKVSEKTGIPLENL